MNTNQSKLIPVLVALLFFGPLVLAGVIYFYGGGQFQPDSSSAHGILFESPTTLPRGPIPLPDTFPATADSIEFGRQWTLLTVGRGDCDDLCREALYHTRQVRRALGRDMSRVQRVLVITAGQPDRSFLAAEHPGLAVIPEDMAVRDRIFAALGQFAAGDVFVVDPIGNVVMRFPAGSEMKDMHTDLAHLLKASQIG